MTASQFPVFAVLGDVNRFLSAPAWLILVCLLMVSPPTEAATPRNVLVLYSHGRLLPANIECDRRLSPHLEALFSLAYFDLSADLQVRVLQQRTEVSRDASWVDPLVGLNYMIPIGSKWTYTLRGDVGGFGVGSDLTWHMITTFIGRTRSGSVGTSATG